MMEFKDGIEMLVISRADLDLGPRGREDYGDLDTLAQSIKANGLMHPIAVNRRADGRYKLIAGGRRTRAMDKLGWTEIPARIYPQEMPLDDIMEMELEENVRRLDMTWPEKAKLTKAIHIFRTKKFEQNPVASIDGKFKRKWTLADTASVTGQNARNVDNMLVLADIIEQKPELAKCATAAEAIREMEKLKEDMVKAELSKRIDAKEAPSEGKERWLFELSKRYIIGDTFEKLKALPDESFNFVDLDPPYGLEENNVHSLSGKDSNAADREEFKNITGEQYPQAIQELTKECYRVMTPNSWIIVWFAFKYYEVTTQALLNANFKLGSYAPGMWSKPKGNTANIGKALHPSFDVFLYAYKGNPTLQKMGHGNIFFNDREQNPWHPTQKPIYLMKQILQVFTPMASSILVPFAGSGTTIIAADDLHMHAVGFDLSETYRNSFLAKLQLMALKDT